EAGDRSADRAAARVRRPARERRDATASAGRATERARAIDERRREAIQRIVGVERAAAIDVLDAVERGVRRVLDAGWKMNAADETDGSRRERRLIVAEVRRRARW